MQEDKPSKDERIFYIRDWRGEPIACLAYSLVDEDTVSYAFSIKHPNDRFDRSLARRIALGRLRKAGQITRVEPGERPVRAAMRRMATEMIPSRVASVIAEYIMTADSVTKRD